MDWNYVMWLLLTFAVNMGIFLLGYHRGRKSKKDDYDQGYKNGHRDAVSQSRPYG